MIGRLLCRLGLHAWGNLYIRHLHTDADSGPWEWTCSRCRKIKREWP